MNAHPYPDGFHGWPQEERNQYFAEEAKSSPQAAANRRGSPP